MHLTTHRSRLDLPESLREQMFQFRRRLWIIKFIEASGCAVLGIMLAYLATFALDRLFDTSALLRSVFFVAALLACAAIPIGLHRWIWNRRKLDQLARLLSQKHPSIGDQLLGIIELVDSETEQARSLALCEAAIHQVADAAERRDFRDAVPSPRHRMFAVSAGVAALVGIVLMAVVPAAAGNAWARFLAPWRDTPRFTFARIESLPNRMVVPHGESFAVDVRLAGQSMWRPSRGSIQIAGQQPASAGLENGAYHFQLPAQLDPRVLDVRIGDFRRQVRVEPTLRPELTSIVANVELPEYLERTQSVTRDVRAGTLSVVSGSRAVFVASASRDLTSARVDNESRDPDGSTVTSPAVAVDPARKLEIRWTDKFGLSGKEPFTVSIVPRDDEPPTVTCDDLPRQRVVLDSEVLTFRVAARDDFGVKLAGIDWEGLDTTTVRDPAKGERILGAGGSECESLDIAGTFSAQSLGIAPQPLHVRVFVEDYFPGRERVYSPAYLFFVLDAEQHAIWLTEMLSKWHRQALEVRDREMQLYETNKQLRDMSPAELDQPDVRKRIETQAYAERTNGRRLSGLVGTGEELIRQAARNPEFGVGHLEKWAEMLQILKDIASSRMPSVADLLKQAAQAAVASAATPTNPTAMAGQIRAASAAPAAKNQPDEPKKSANAPAVVDIESSQQPPKQESESAQANNSKSGSRLGLPQTVLYGGGSSDNSPSPPAQKIDEAVTQQQDLLAEFEKIADELNRILANLEGSTIVKRLKAASRFQFKIAGRLSDQLNAAFGLPAATAREPLAKLFTDLAGQEVKSSNDVSVIMDDMQSYFERRHFVSFRTVLDDMRKQDVIGGLRSLGSDLGKESALSIAQCEYWSDTLDRWAEDLVDASAPGKCPGAKSRNSLPPSIVLEVLKILESEINLREETRVAEQAKPAIASDEHREQAGKLSVTQDQLRQRVDRVNQQIAELPDAAEQFAPETSLLNEVADVMRDATAILASAETGSPAIGAETDAIELLLQSKRINPKGRGGGGATPGGGGGGDTVDSALALIGRGANEKEVRDDRGVAQSTGDSGPRLPEEFRAGLDEYFSRLEKLGDRTDATQEVRQ